MTRYGMVVDTGRCTGCQTCVVACQMHNALRPGVAWLRVDAVSWGRWPDGGYLFLPHACLHCDEAPCVGVCPTGASRRGADGVVSVDEDTCIGCGVCVAACPYGARTVNRDARWFFGASEAAPYEAAGAGRVGVAEKCTFCAPRRARGLEPACVAACPNGARAFGDLDDPASDAARFSAETGADRAGSTGMCYALPEYGAHVDPEAAIRELRAAKADEGESGADAAGRSGASGKGSPAVLAGAGVAGAAAVAGIAVAARRSRRPSPDGLPRCLRKEPGGREGADGKPVENGPVAGCDGGVPTPGPDAGHSPVRP